MTKTKELFQPFTVVYSDKFNAFFSILSVSGTQVTGIWHIDDLKSTEPVTEPKSIFRETCLYEYMTKVGKV